MQYTTEQLCKNVQGCVFGYCQSDEISLLLVDYKKLNSDAWFDYNIQKCSSVAASLATNYFKETEKAAEIYLENVKRMADKNNVK